MILQYELAARMSNTENPGDLIAIARQEITLLSAIHNIRLPGKTLRKQ